MPVAIGEFVGEYGDPVLGTPSNHVFDLKEDFGAIGDDGDGAGADDTAAFQLALNTAAQVKGADIYLDEGVYKIAGALQDPTGANAQLVLPSVSAPSEEQYTVRLLGKRPPSQIPWYLGGGNTPKTGVIIKSTLASGNGALLGGKGPGGTFESFDNITVGVENINFRMPTNPTNSCLNFFDLNSAVIKNVVVDSGNWVGSTIVQPTTLTSCGIKMPKNDNGGNNFIDQTQVVGFATGLFAGEHMSVGTIEIYECIVGVNFPFCYHSSQFARLLLANCSYMLRWSGAHYTRVTVLDLEHTAASAWYTTTYDIDDVNNYGHGILDYHTVTSGIGVVNDSGVLRNGGNNLLIRPLTRSDSRVLLGNNPTNEPSIYANNDYLVLNSRAGNPLHLNYDNTNAAATVSFFNGKAAVRASGALKLPLIADSAAANDSWYFSTTANAAAYKDSGGAVHPLY